MYPGPGSNRYSEELVFETSASTNSATWASVIECANIEKFMIDEIKN